MVWALYVVLLASGDRMGTAMDQLAIYDTKSACGQMRSELDMAKPSMIKAKYVCLPVPKQ